MSGAIKKQTKSSSLDGSKPMTWLSDTTWQLFGNRRLVRTSMTNFELMWPCDHVNKSPCNVETWAYKSRAYYFSILVLNIFVNKYFFKITPEYVISRCWTFLRLCGPSLLPFASFTSLRSSSLTEGSFPVTATRDFLKRSTLAKYKDDSNRITFIPATSMALRRNGSNAF